MTLFPEIQRIDLEGRRKAVEKANSVQLLSIYNDLTTQGAPPCLVLNLFIDCLMPKINWEKKWNEFEKDGLMTFFDFSIGCYRLMFVDLTYRGTGFHLNDFFVLNWSETDTVGKEMTKKIIKNLKEHIKQNQWQYHELILKENGLK